MKFLKLIYITLLFLVLAAQSSSAQEFDILDFMPSILAGVVNTDNDGDGYSENQGDCNDSNPDIYPTNDELCDGLDNDCDTASADGSEDPQDGAACDGSDTDFCEEGITSCLAGVLVCSDNSSSTLDVCNGVDDDCDPASEDGSEDSQDGAACNTGQQGVCATGTTTCVAGALSCAANTGPSAESCNGLDDDCDGQTDEGVCGNSFVSNRRTGMKALNNVQE
jgi:hypothetical protein